MYPGGGRTATVPCIISDVLRSAKSTAGIPFLQRENRVGKRHEDNGNQISRHVGANYAKRTAGSEREKGRIQRGMKERREK
jgi:hypothetical protein